MIDTIVFDLDGTLVDTNELVADSWRYTVKTHADSGITEDEIRGTMGELLLDSLKRILPETDPEEALETYREYQRELFLDRIRLFDGAEEVLRELHGSGIKNGLLTSRLITSATKALEHFGLTELFDAVLTASDTKVFKPDPAPVYEILGMLGSRPEEAIFVGDTVHDIEAGLAAGLYTVLVDWSYALPPEKRADVPKPDAVIKSMKELLTLIKEV